LDGRYYHLSFDDGFKNNLTNAAPLLVERQIPASFFIATDFIGVSYAAAERYCSEQLRLEGVVEFLNWDDCRSLVSHGFEVGSHTRGHVVLSSQRPKELREELQISRKVIQDQLSVACDFFAWPFGQPSDVEGVEPDAFWEAGYQAVFGAFRGRVQPRKTLAHAIPRHHLEPFWPLRQSLLFCWGGRGEPA